MNIAGFRVPGTKVDVCSFGDIKSGDPTNEIHLRMGNNSLIFKFSHFSDEKIVCKSGTFCTLAAVVDIAHSGIYYVIPSSGTAILHPKDTYNRKIGARLSAKRAIYNLEEFVISDLAVERRDIYRAVRLRLPMDEKSINVGGFIDEKKPYIVGES